MRIVKALILVALLSVATGCACRTRKVGAEDANIPIAGEGGILGDVRFAFDSYSLDEGSKSILRQNAAWLKGNPDKKVTIEGHCDERGTNEYNMVLGSSRAKAVLDYMRLLGIEGGRMNTISYGEELPLDPRHNEAAWEKNRRAHFDIR